MGEATIDGGLQPSLLDRLTDDEPLARREPLGRRTTSVERLRECVLRDLGWLLNTANLSCVEPIDAWPEVERSVLNFGIGDLAGLTASSIDLAEIERAVRRAIQDFEPRILRRSVHVAATLDHTRHGHNALILDIEGELWARPLPLRLRLESEIDLETGSVTVVDHGSRERS